jgi:chromosome partitioning protein
MGVFKRSKKGEEHITHVGVHDATKPDTPAAGGRVELLHGVSSGGNGEAAADSATLGASPGKQERPVEATRIVAVANQKGGVGKTTTTINLAAYLALNGSKTWIIDLDPQGNATSGLGVDSNMLEECVYEVLMKRTDIDNIIRPTGIDNLYLAPASFRLVGAQVELVNIMSRETRLREIVAGLKGKYSFVVVDCPPSLGLLTVNALTAAEELVIPVQCEYFALEGLTQLLDSINEVKKYLNPGLKMAGILMTMYDARTKIAQEVVEEVRAHYPGEVYTTIIPRSVRLSEAPSYGQPIASYDSLSRGAIAYKELAEEVMKHG